MAENIKYATCKLATRLLHNKFVVVLGDSIQRTVYKDIVLLLQKDCFLTSSQLKAKGERSFEQDSLVEGGCLGQMHNGIQYREVRQFRSNHHLVRFYFITQIYSEYMLSILEDFRHGLKPDLVIINSCLWDITRYAFNWAKEYRENLNKFFEDLTEILPPETLVIWNLGMPLSKKVKGGFLTAEIKYKAPQLRYDVVEANFYSGTLAHAYGMDVVDLHFRFRFSMHHRVKDGVHWDALAHRSITSLLLQHIAQAWGVTLLDQPAAFVGIDSMEEWPTIQRTVMNAVPWRAAGDMNGCFQPLMNSPNTGFQSAQSRCVEEFHTNSIPMSLNYINFTGPNDHWQQCREAPTFPEPSHPPQPHEPVYRHQPERRPSEYFRDMSNRRPPFNSPPPAAWRESRQYVIKRYNYRSHYAPYQQRPNYAPDHHLSHYAPHRHSSHYTPYRNFARYT